jgi:hypothetical protein
MSRYGNSDKQTLLDLADQLSNSIQTSKDMSGMTFDQAIEHIGKQQKLATEATDMLSKLDPTFRTQFRELERLAVDASNQKKIADSLSNEVKKFYEKNKSVIGRPTQTIETWLNSMSAGGMRRINKGDVLSTTADRNIEHLQNWIMNGDETAVNQAIDNLRKLREIDVLNRRNIQGSRQVAQAGAMGHLAGWVAKKTIGVDITPVAIPFAIMADKTAREFTHGKWTRLQPYLIEKMLKRNMEKWNATIGSGLLGGAIGRAAYGSQEPSIEIEPGSQEAYAAAEIIKRDNSLNPAQKTETIKKIINEGIRIGG